MMKINKHTVQYQPGQSKNWTGRETALSLGNQYWYQAVQCINLEKEEVSSNVALLGYVCDEGVQRNLGRIGAKEGPKAVRERLSKVALHTDKKIIDMGDVVCIDGYMEECQEAFSSIVTTILSKDIFPIGMGGGHDIAYASFMGVYNAVKGTAKNIGIINFDAHFDLRPVVQNSNSGTPFNQIIDELKYSGIVVNYFPVGIQHQANTKELFDIVKQENISYIDSFTCDFRVIKEQLIDFIGKNDYIYVTIDMDGFSSAYAPGVSAPSPLGFTPQFVMESLQFLLKSKKVIACDLAELNPTYDIDNQTANLTARLIDFIVTKLD